MAGEITSRSNVQGKTKVLEKVFYNKAKAIPPLYEKIFNIIHTNPKRGFATFLPMTEIGTLEFKPEGASPVYDSPFENIPITVNYVTYALAVKATEEGSTEDPENIVGEIAGQLADACRETKDLTFNNVFNTAFSGSVLGADAQPLISAVHPLGPRMTSTGVISQTGQTFSNSLGAAALTPQSLQAGYILFETLLSDRGRPDRRTAQTLMVHPNLVKVGQEILGSAGVPYTNDNTKNVVEGTVQLLGNRYLTNPNAYFILGGKGDPFSGGDNHQIFAAIKWDNRYKVWTDDETDNYNQKVSTRFTYGFGGWRGVVGSLGAAGNY